MGIGGLDIALSGLRVAQQQLSVISSNVANVNTDGYTRKILPQANIAVDGQSVGVRANPIIRNVDLNLERDFWTQVSTVEFHSVKETYLERIQNFHGPPDLEVSIAAELAKLRDSFSALADSPEDTFLQRAAVDQAVRLSNKINDFASLISEMRNDTQREIQVSVNTVNEKLAQIADLNNQIKYNSISGKSTAAFEDARDQAIFELSQEMEVSFFKRGDGVLVVQTAGGVQLADERAETVYFNPVPVGPNTFYPDPSNPDAGGLFVRGLPSDTPLAIDITESNLNGRIGALLELRDDTLPRQQAMLDELSHKMASSFQAQGLTLFTDATGQVPSDSIAHVVGTVDLATLGALDVATGANNLFTITLNAGGFSPPSTSFQIDLAVANTPALLASEINTQIGLLQDAYGDTLATIDANGQLDITSDFDITISATGAGEIGDAGLAVLGLTRGTNYAAPSTSPTVTPVPYVGFSNEIKVNQLVLDNNLLVQQGTATTDLPVQAGSNEVIRRVIEFVFGDDEYQEAINIDTTTQVDLRASLGGDSLQNWLGIFSQNNITSSVDLSQYSDVQALIDAGGDTFQPPTAPVLDQFTITFDDPRTGLPAQTYYLDLEEIQANFPIAGPITNAAEQIAAAINALPLAGSALSDPLPPDPAFDVQASVNGFGQLVITSRANITIDASFPSGETFPPAVTPDGGMRQNGLDFLGLTEDTFTTTDPYIEVQVGNDPPIRITIEPGDDETDLYDKLNLIAGGVDTTGVPGLAIDDDLTDPLGNGTLILRPGDDPTNPGFGGDLKIIGGPFEVSAAGTGPNAAALGTGIVEALFGISNPVRAVPYEISTGSGTYEAFRRSGLGPDATIDTGIISSTNLIDFAQKMVNKHAEESISNDSKLRDETSFRDLLKRRLLDESGVNMDEELSNLIVIQTAFAAAARVISAISEEFDELLNAVR